MHRRIGVEGDRIRSQLTSASQKQPSAGSLPILQHGLVLALFLALSLAFFGWPVIGHMQSRYIGQTEDPVQFIAAMLWWPWAIQHGTNPFIDHWLWAPHGQPLLWVTSMPSISLLLSPVTALWGPVASYNVAEILGPALSAWSMYFLLRVFTRSLVLQMWGGYVFGFSSYTIGQTLAHLFLTWTFPLPLLVLIGVRVYQYQAKNIRPPVRYRVWASILLLFLFGASLEIFATLAFFVTVTLALALILSHRRRDLRSRLLVFIRWELATYGLVVVLLSPAVIWMAAHPAFSGPPHSPVTFSTDLLNFFVPTYVTWLGGQVFWGVSHLFLGNWFEQGAYLGLPLIVLSVISIQKNWDQFWIKILSGMLICVAVLSLGPILHIAGYPFIPLPWTVFQHVPILQDALPARFSVYVAFLVSLLTTMGLDRLSPDKLRVKYYALAGVSLLFLLPNVSWGRSGWSTPMDIPSFFLKPSEYQRIIPHNSNVLIFPYGSYGNGIAMQIHTDFWFRLANGYWGIPPSKYGEWPVVQQLWLLPAIPHNAAIAVQFAGLLKNQGVRRVVALSPYALPAGRLLKEIPGSRKIYSGPHVAVWSISPAKAFSGTPSLSSVLSRSDLLQFQALNNAARMWLTRHPGDVGPLSPAFLESRHLLNSSFGAIANSGANRYWTDDGGWVGAVGRDMYGIGITGSGTEIEPIIRQDGPTARRIYFPYPRQLTKARYSVIHHIRSGELLMVFSAPPKSSLH